MKKESKKIVSKKLNVFGLISVLLVPVILLGFFLVLLNRMYQLIPMADLDVTPWAIIIGITLIIGIGMLATGIIAVVKSLRNKGAYKGNWTGYVGLVLGAIFTVIPLFLVIEFLAKTK
jgi:hypothetical protein